MAADFLILFEILGAEWDQWFTEFTVTSSSNKNEH